MPTDEDRREVARRLRELRLKPWDDTACEIASCVGIVCCNSECHGSDETPECTMALAHRLADLIEPPLQCPHYHSDRHYCSVHEDVAATDRDALLALVDELENKAYFAGVSPWDVIEYAHRIREALGVEE